MPLWSLTVERLERLKAQIEAKKAEHDELEALTEKDLWCKDLDAFAEEWENQLLLDAEIQTSIRRMGRRVSKKIGAGRGRKAKGDDDYQPTKKAARAPKATPPVETKTHQRFAEKFAGKPKPKPKTEPVVPKSSGLGNDGAADDMSDDDFSLLGKPKAVEKPAETLVSRPAPATAGRNKRAAASKSKTYLEDDDEEDSDLDFEELGKPTAASAKLSAASEKPPVSTKPSASASASASASEVEEVAAPEPRNKRAAASKAKSWVVDDDESESDGDNLLGDVGAMVKGIGGSTSGGNDRGGGRLSLFAMSQPDSAPKSGGGSSIPRVRAKPSRTFDVDSHDDTNYEALAMSSPRKSTKGDDLDSFLSDDDLPAPSKVTAVAKSSSQAAAPKTKAALGSASGLAKSRGRPAGSKNKAKEPAAKPKPVQLSPAAKAYAAKKAKAASRVLSDDDDEDDIMADVPAPAPAKPRTRPGRAAATKRKPIVLDEDEDGDSDEFAMDDSE